MTTLIFHHALNPTLWQQHRLKPIVRLKLFQTAIAFYKFLDVPRLIVIDIILTGSNAAYNYTDLSDIDVHLIVDFVTSSCPTLADNFFSTKKNLWGQTYSTSIHDSAVELYVEDAATPVKANGIFSILHDRWLKRPSPERPNPDDNAVRQKCDAYRDMIDDLLAGSPDLKQVIALIERLRTMRQSGLQVGGEFSTENICYKNLRNNGDINRLYSKMIELRDRQLSL